MENVEELENLTEFLYDNWVNDEINKLGLAHNTSEYPDLIERTFQLGKPHIAEYLMDLWSSVQPDFLPQFKI